MTQATVLAWRGTGLVRLFDRQAHGDGGWGTRLARHGETIVESLRIIRHWQGLVLMQAGYRYLGIWLALGGLQLGQQASAWEGVLRTSTTTGFDERRTKLRVGTV